MLYNHELMKLKIVEEDGRNREGTRSTAFDVREPS